MKMKCYKVVAVNEDGTETTISTLHITQSCITTMDESDARCAIANITMMQGANVVHLCDRTSALVREFLAT